MTTKKPAPKPEVKPAKPTAPGRPVHVRVEESTPAARIAMAREMADLGLISTSDALAAVISTGRLWCAVCGNGFAENTCSACGNPRGQS